MCCNITYKLVCKAPIFSSILYNNWINVLFSIFIICGFGFLFFAMLPFANNCLDYLVRTNIPDELQGRAWGFIGFLSQLGYVVAYGAGGLLADGMAKILATDVGRGAGVVIIFSGVCLAVTAAAMSKIKSIQALSGGMEQV